MSDSTDLLCCQIKPNCTQCKACIPVCPTDSIILGTGQYVIDTDTCEGCGMCAKICPENAIREIPRES